MTLGSNPCGEDCRPGADSAQSASDDATAVTAQESETRNRCDASTASRAREVARGLSRGVLPVTGGPCLTTNARCAAAGMSSTRRQRIRSVTAMGRPSSAPAKRLTNSAPVRNTTSPNRYSGSAAARRKVGDATAAIATTHPEHEFAPLGLREGGPSRARTWIPNARRLMWFF